MDFIRWVVDNFGLFFGAVFLLYIYLMLHRLILLYDRLRLIPARYAEIPDEIGNHRALKFLDPMFARLRRTIADGGHSTETVIDALWSEMERQVSIHFTALHGYVNTLILVGFAGTIFGSIGAFNEMFRELALGKSAAGVFAASWSHGLGTALYTSLGAAGIGGAVVTVLCSRFLMGRAKQLEILVALRIGELMEEGAGGDAQTV